jgi:hypothetical protein
MSNKLWNPLVFKAKHLILKEEDPPKYGMQWIVELPTPADAGVAPFKS